MDCRFRILTKDENTFNQLKKYANGWSKNLIIIENKCNFLDFLKQFDIEILITPFNTIKIIDCFYFNKELFDCDDEILNKFDMSKYEPIQWK